MEADKHLTYAEFLDFIADKDETYEYSTVMLWQWVARRPVNDVSSAN